MELPDLLPLTDAEVLQIRAHVEADIRRRTVLNTAVEQTEQWNKEYVAAIGRKDGDVWVQPQGAHDAYSKGATASRDGVLYESRIPSNVWPPGDPSDPQSGRWWKKVEVPGTPAPPPTPPTGDPWAEWKNYPVGHHVTYEAKLYRVLQFHTSQPGWAPPNAPALFELVGDAAPASSGGGLVRPPKGLDTTSRGDRHA